MTSSKLLLDRPAQANKRPIFLPIVISVTVILVTLLLAREWIDFNYVESEEVTSCPIQKFDYTLLAIRWPPGICKSSDCVEEFPQDWLIHGLWPNYSNGSWPQFCCPSTPFDSDQVEPIRSKLERAWANLQSGKSVDSLWEHEWDKHGTCSTLDVKLRGQLHYFNYTLSLFSKLPVQEWLTDASITPNDNTPYEYSDFYGAIQKRFQKRFTLQCQKSGSKTYLQQMEFCFDKLTFEHRDCDHSNSASCKNGFLYTK